MIISNKYVNDNYLQEEVYVPASPNIRNKKLIDDWVSRYYQALYTKFSRNDEKMTQKGYQKRDILHESLFRIYTNSKRFKNQSECDNYLNNFFHIK